MVHRRKSSKEFEWQHAAVTILYYSYSDLTAQAINGRIADLWKQDISPRVAVVDEKLTALHHCINKDDTRATDGETERLLGRTVAVSISIDYYNELSNQTTGLQLARCLQGTQAVAK